MTKRIFSAALFLTSFFFGFSQATWVGGATGNWNVGANWSTSSVPQDDEDVVISGAVTVTINTAITQAPDDMTISAGATLVVATGGSLSTADGGFQGDLTLDNGTINVTGGTLFIGDDINSSNGSSITVSSGTFQVDDDGVLSDTDVTVSGGSFLMGDGDGDDHDFTNGSTITVSGGTFDVRDITVTDSNVDITAGTIEVDDFYINGTSTVDLDGGTVGSTGRIETNDTAVLNVNTTVTNTTGSGNIDDDIDIFGSSTVNVGSGGSLTGFDDIDFENGDAGAATLNINGGTVSVLDDVNFDGSQNDAINISGGTLTVPNDVDILDTNAQITVTGGTLDAGVIDDTANGGSTASDNINVSGAGTVEENGTVVLPVELLNFTAKLENGHAVITWETAAELNNERFELEKSADGNNYLTIATIKGHGTTSERSQYSYTDHQVLPGTYFYRLIQYDYDGENEVLPTIALVNSAAVATSSMKVYPNPVIEDRLTVALEGSIINSQWSASLYNLKGQLVIQQDGAVGSPSLTIDNLHARVQPGIYLLRVQGAQTSLGKRVVIK